MRSTSFLVLGATGAILLLSGGCGKQGVGQGKGPEASVPQMLVSAITRPDPLVRGHWAEALANAPPAELGKVLPELKEALAREKDARVKAALQRAVQAADSSAGGSLSAEDKTALQRALQTGTKLPG